MLPSIGAIDERVLPYLQDTSAAGVERAAAWMYKAVKWLTKYPDLPDDQPRIALTNLFFEMMTRGGESGGSAINLIFNTIMSASQIPFFDAVAVQKFEKAYIIMMPRWLDYMLNGIEISTD